MTHPRQVSAALVALALVLPQPAGARSDVVTDAPGAVEQARDLAEADWPEIDLPAEVLAIIGDRDYGEYLASECTTCHQRDGGAEGIPSITHWPEAQLVMALHAYREGLRPHQGMQTVARRLGDEEIAALAAYFATIED